MNDQEILERAERAATRLVGSAAPYEDLLRRRDRKRRNQRITAGVVGIAVFVAAVWIVTSGAPAERTQTPADVPSPVEPTDPAEDVVRGFIAAFGAFDAEAAMTYVADDADLRGLIDPPTPANRRGLSQTLALLEAVGYQLTINWCRADPFESGTSVVCAFDFTTFHAVELGRGWFTGSTFVFTVRDGRIVMGELARANFLHYASRVTAPFAKWLAATHPRDFEVMYGAIPSHPGGFRFVHSRLTDESIRLFGLRTREYVEAVQQGTA
jgi:ketosteroid isomerase-like protein